MFSRPFMKKQDKLTVLFDSTSIDNMPALNRRSRALLKYQNSQLLDFIRSPENVESKDLQQIVGIEKKYNPDGSLHSIEIARGESVAKHAFFYRKEVIERIGQVLYKKEKLNADENRKIELVFIQAVLNRDNGLNILVTSDAFLLKNRLWFEAHFPGGAINIMTIDEAAEIVDLFLKSRGRYCISCNYTVNKGYWYWLSFRTKVPFYHVDSKAVPFEQTILETFAQRFVFLLESVDEIGFQYYSGVSNDTMDSMIYHFNYFISLVTGIFDSLAIRTFNQYKLVFKGSNIRSRISLRKDVGRHFLRAVREENLALRKHINDYIYFVNVIYLLRERVLHREGLRQACFEYRGEDEQWKANLIKIPRTIIAYLKRCGDLREVNEPWTEFGVYGRDFLEPFRFTKSSALLLSEFCNKYLQLLGFGNFFKEMKKSRPQDEFLSTIRLFEEDNVGL